jgi:hypothetical protein
MKFYVMRILIAYSPGISKHDDMEEDEMDVTVCVKEMRNSYKILV